jgi:hypothetical protein
MTMANVRRRRPVLEPLTRFCVVAVVSIVSLARDSAAQPKIGILPQASRVCPGQSISATYVERLADGSQVDLSASDVRQIARDDDAATLRSGSWQTSADPMRSVVTGFRLSVALARDSSVRGDTVVPPSYDCPRATVQLGNSERREGPPAYVRLGTFDTPFYDSVVVAVVEVEGRPPGVIVLSPKEMVAGAIKVAAAGRNGLPGRAGRPGSDGTDCASGDTGEDGQPGEPGLPGREVDIIAQQGSPWLANLVAVYNPGGRGGDGGAGGRGGAGATGPTGRGRGCRAAQGRSGRQGVKGPDGPAGNSKTTTVPAPLLWPGSPIWSDSVARRAIEGLLAYEKEKRR